MNWRKLASLISQTSMVQCATLTSDDQHIPLARATAVVLPRAIKMRLKQANSPLPHPTGTLTASFHKLSIITEMDRPLPKVADEESVRKQLGSLRLGPHPAHPQMPPTMKAIIDKKFLSKR
jgi:hypothetical protein